MYKEITYEEANQRIKALMNGEIPEKSLTLPVCFQKADWKKHYATLKLDLIPGRLMASLIAEDMTGCGRTFTINPASPFHSVFFDLCDWMRHKLRDYIWHYVEMEEEPIINATAV